MPAAIFLARRQGWRLRRSGPWLAVGLVAVVVSLLIELLRGEYLLIPQDPFTLLGLVLAALLVVVAALLFPAALALLEAARAEQLLPPSFAEAARENPAMAMVCAAAIGCCILGLLTLVAAALRLVPGSAQYSGWGALGSRAWAGPLERLISLFPFGLMRVTVFAVLLTLTRSRWAAAAPTAILFNMLDLPLGVTPWGLERGLALFESSAVTAVLVWLGPLAAVGAEMACFASGSLLSLVRFGAPGDALLSVVGLAIVVGIAASSIPQVRQLLGRRDTLAETPTVPSPRSTPDIGPVSPPGSTPEAISGIEPGVVLAGRYQVTSEIGRGGMGRVLRARDLKLGRAVAVKVLNPGVHDDKQRQRFEQEARAAGALNHPNILAVHDVGEHDGDPYIVSELLEGETLRKVLLSGALPSAEALDLATQVAAGLAAAHAKGIVHRDLKPENLFLTDDGRLKILDFGIAKLLDSHGAPQALTETGAILGTPAYVSPEQVRGQRSDERSDVFSFGAVLHEMLAGEGPFNRDTAPETGYAILNDPPGPLPASTSALLRRVVTRCLQKSPDERYANAGEILHDLGQQPRRFALKPGA